MTFKPERLKGVVATPALVAAALCRWAIRDTTDTLLDPCSGAGVFPRAAHERYAQLRAPRAEELVFGVDIDDAAADAFEASGSKRKNFVRADFMTLRGHEFPARFSAVVANPPYIRHHDLTDRESARAIKALSVAGHLLPKSANYWAYFVLHAMRFLREGGRMAFVLPGGFLNTDFAVPVRNTLAHHFERLHVVTLDECIFHRVEEEAVLLMCDGKVAVGSAQAKINVGRQSIHSLKMPEPNETACELPADLSRALLSQTERDAYEQLSNKGRPLGESFEVRIGVVTGSNRFFVRSRAERELLPARCWKPIVTKSRQLPGLVFTRADVRMMSKSDAAFLAKLTRSDLKSSRVRGFVSAGETEGVHEASHCARREDWFDVTLGEQPNLFLTPLCAVAPALVVNDGHLHSTNTVHNLYVKSGVDLSPQVAAVGFATTLAQLGAEIEGRGYGGGALKIEPSGARRIPLPMMRGPVNCESFDAADRARRDRNFGLLTQIADSIFYDDRDAKAIRLLGDVLERLRSRRFVRSTTWRSAEPEVVEPHAAGGL